MKKLLSLTTLSAFAAISILPSCGIVKSAARVPGSLLKAVGRTAGMNVNDTAKPSPATPTYETVDGGEIKQLD